MFSDVLKGYRNEKLGWNGLMVKKIYKTAATTTTTTTEAEHPFSTYEENVYNWRLPIYFKIQKQQSQDTKTT